MAAIKTKKVSIPVGEGDHTSGVLSLPDGPSKKIGVIAAHGAGNDMNTPLIVAFTEGLAASGYPALRFNFLYKERGRKAPDNETALEETWLAAYRFMKEAYGSAIDYWVGAGKSMGGRIAAHMVADRSLPVDRLIFLGYPLHSMTNKEKLRDAQLYQIGIPMLFFAGTRDLLCDLTKLQAVVKKFKAPCSLHLIEGGDHSFHVLKSVGTTDEEIYGRIVRQTIEWLAGLTPP
jgi:predicted alpha/beta-hydrolase family hydrolase